MLCSTAIQQLLLTNYFASESDVARRWDSWLIDAAEFSDKSNGFSNRWSQLRLFTTRCNSNNKWFYNTRQHTVHWHWYCAAQRLPYVSSGPIFRCLWIKVCQIKSSHVGEIVVFNAIYDCRYPVPFRRFSFFTFKVVWNCAKFWMFSLLI